MSVNQFLPRPIRLYQAFNSDTSSGGPSSNEITRRSFLKRTGGATIATLVAWNMATREAEAMANAFSDGISVPTFTKHIVICTDEPTMKEFAMACSGDQTDPVDERSIQAWRAIRNIDISANVKGCNRDRTPINLHDDGGNGYSFFLLHWITVDGVIIRKGDYITACRRGDSMASKIVPHAAIVQGKWYWAPSGRKEWGYNTVLSMSLDQSLRGVVMADGLCPSELALVVRNESTSEYKRLDVNGQVTGWLNVSGSFFPDQGNTEGKGTTVVQRWLSCAAFIPKMTLETISDNWTSTLCLAGSYSREAGVLSKNKLEIGGEYNYSTSVLKNLKVNNPPAVTSHNLSWIHQKSEGPLALTPQVEWPTFVDPKKFLPHDWA